MKPIIAIPIALATATLAVIACWGFTLLAKAYNRYLEAHGGPPDWLPWVLLGVVYFIIILIALLSPEKPQ